MKDKLFVGFYVGIYGICLGLTGWFLWLMWRLSAFLSLQGF